MNFDELDRMGAGDEEEDARREDAKYRRAALKEREQALLEHGDPLSGDDWQAMQDVRAAIADTAESLSAAMSELCARLQEHFEAAGHPTCPDPECDYVAYENAEHAPNCAYAKYVASAELA